MRCAVRLLQTRSRSCAANLPSRLVEHRHQFGDALVRQLLGKEVPEDHLVHRTGIFGRLPLACTDNRIGCFARCENDRLKVFFMHEPVNGHAQSLFSPARNRLLKILDRGVVRYAAQLTTISVLQRRRPLRQQMMQLAWPSIPHRTGGSRQGRRPRAELREVAVTYSQRYHASLLVLRFANELECNRIHDTPHFSGRETDKAAGRM